jgi:hypothetical protein
VTKRNRPNMAVGQNVLVALWMVLVTSVCINHFGNDGSLGVQGVDPQPSIFFGTFRGIWKLAMGYSAQTSP